jgi:hypothetical protein
LENKGDSMGIDTIAIIISTITLVVNIGAFIILIMQTRYLSAQTEALRKSIAYSSYQKLNDEINAVNNLMLDHDSVVKIFKQMKSMKQRMKEYPGLSMEKIALAWHMLNRYESAYIGHKLEVIPEAEWIVWVKRMELDINTDFLREVWRQDLQSWDYDEEFKQLINKLLLPWNENDHVAG